MLMAVPKPEDAPMADLSMLLLLEFEPELRMGTFEVMYILLSSVSDSSPSTPRLPFVDLWLYRFRFPPKLVEVAIDVADVGTRSSAKTARSAMLGFRVSGEAFACCSDKTSMACK